MRVIVDFLICLVSLIVSWIIFTLIFTVLNQSILKIFVNIQNFVDKLNRKKFVKIIIMAISIGLCAEIKDFYNLNYIGLGILLGFFNALSDVIFKTSFVSKKTEKA